MIVEPVQDWKESIHEREVDLERTLSSSLCISLKQDFNVISKITWSQTRLPWILSFSSDYKNTQSQALHHFCKYLLLSWGFSPQSCSTETACLSGFLWRRVTPLTVSGSAPRFNLSRQFCLLQNPSMDWAWLIVMSSGSLTVAGAAPGSAFSLLLWASIIQGNHGPHVLSLISHSGRDGTLTVGLRLRVGFWCDKLPRYNSVILSACVPADPSLCYQLQSKRVLSPRSVLLPTLWTDVLNRDPAGWWEATSWSHRSSGGPERHLSVFRGRPARTQDCQYGVEEEEHWKHQAGSVQPRLWTSFILA